VLLIHEDAFQRHYLARVIEDFGATVLGPAPAAAPGLALLAGDPAPMAVALSDAVEDAVAVAAAAQASGIAILLLGSLRSSERPITVDHHLPAPFSGFQLVEALNALLHGRGTGLSSRSGPHLQGH
jgi:hypothetical protein